MAIKTFASGEILTASDTNTYLANAGLVYITSTTVGSAVSSVTVSNCFSSTYDNYMISIAGIVGASAANALTAQFTASGTASTTGYYGNTFYISTGAAGSLTNATFSNGAFLEVMSLGNSTGGTSGVFQIQSPNRAAFTTVQFTNTDASYWRTGSFVHQVATAYDGIKISTYGITMTGGTITVYGYRKA